jgi:hypothetical protein
MEVGIVATAPPRKLTLLAIMLPLASWIAPMALVVAGHGQGGGSIPNMTPFFQAMSVVILGHATGIALCVGALITCHRKKRPCDPWLMVPIMYHLFLVTLLLMATTMT